MKDERFLRPMTKADLIELRDVCGDPIYKRALRTAINRIEKLENKLRKIAKLTEEELAM
jgi:hypothetical protein